MSDLDLGSHTERSEHGIGLVVGDGIATEDGNGRGDHIGLGRVAASGGEAFDLGGVQGRGHETELGDRLLHARLKSGKQFGPGAAEMRALVADDIGPRDFDKVLEPLAESEEHEPVGLAASFGERLHSGLDDSAAVSDRPAR